MWYLFIYGLIPWETSDTARASESTTDLAMVSTSSTVSTNSDEEYHEVSIVFFFDLSDCFRKIKVMEFRLLINVR